MKPIKSLILCLCIALCCCTAPEERSHNVLKVYNWADYISDEVLESFPAWYKSHTGEDVEIIYQTFDINESMLSEIEIGHEDYDVICPSEYIIERMLRNNLLLPIDKSCVPDSISYFDNVSAFATDKFQQMSPDAHTLVSDYTVGYMWGTTGFLYNPRYVSQEEVSSWGVLLNDRFRDQIFMKDAYRDVYSVLVQYAYNHDILCGDESREDLVSDMPPEAIDSVEHFLLRAKPNIAAWEVDFGKEEMTKGKVWLDLLWSGDAQWAIDQARENGVELRYIVPKEGSNVWLDGWCIPKYAKNVKAATYFIDYLCREDNAILNMEEIGYVSVIGTDAILDWATSDSSFTTPLDVSYFFGASGKDICVNPVFYPDKCTIDRCALMHDCADKTEDMLAMWERVKGDNFSFFMLGSLIGFITLIIIIVAVRLSRNTDLSRIINENNKKLR